MKEDLVSIIIPCYNASRYLKDVFLSIQNQTYQNIEVIFVDDGSTDETGKMLDEFKKIYPKARVVHKPNGGSSSARNAGLAIARGKYIYFMDADDIIHPSAITLAHDLINKFHSDVVSFSFKRISNDKKYLKKFPNLSHKSTNYEGSDNVYLSFISRVNGRSAWGKLFDNKSLRKVQGYPKVFDEQCFYGEDVLFNTKFFQLCKNVVWSEAKTYYWRKVNTSMMHSAFKEKELSVLKFEPFLKKLDPITYPESLKYVPSVICFIAMDLISKLSHSDYQNPKVVNEIYHRYRDNLKYLPRLSRLPLAYRFGTLFTLPIMYLMVRKKLKG